MEVKKLKLKEGKFVEKLNETLYSGLKKSSNASENKSFIK